MLLSERLTEAAAKSKKKKLNKEDFSPIDRKKKKKKKMKKRTRHTGWKKRRHCQSHTVKNEIRYIWWVAMSQQNAQILFMEVDSRADQWVSELLKYTRPSPAVQTPSPRKTEAFKSLNSL